MNSIQLSLSPIADFNILKKNTWIVLTDIEKTPPHASIIQDGLWYSLRFKESKIGGELSGFTTMIIRKKIPAVLLEIDIAPTLSSIAGFYAKYNKIDIAKNITCVTPFNEYLASIKLLHSDNLLLWETIQILYEKQLILRCMSCFADYSCYLIKKYNREDLITLLL